MVREDNNPAPRSQHHGGLIVGSYCHDVLFNDDVVIAETLGGAASFISAVLDGLSIPSAYYAAKVGPDFAYSSEAKNNQPPIVCSLSSTTLFHAHFSSSSQFTRQDRVLRRVQSCEPIFPSDIPESRFDFGMAVGVAGEILPETLERMLDLCDVVLADSQSLIRSFDPEDGTVRLRGLKESGFIHLLPRLRFLKASSEEAPFVDVEEARKWCCVILTKGKDGCTLYWKDWECRIPPFPTVQVDPTGAGDSFLGGFVAGLVHGLLVPDAALLGNFFGSLTVGQIGVPNFDIKFLQRVKDEICRQKTRIPQFGCNGYVEIMKQLQPLSLGGRGGHYDEFHASLVAAAAEYAKPNGQISPAIPQQQGEAVVVVEPHFSNPQHKLLSSPDFEEPPVQPHEIRQCSPERGGLAINFYNNV